MSTRTTGLGVQDSDWDDWDAQIACPVCGFEYVHFNPEVVTTQSDDYVPGPNRGGQIVIGFWCENDHRFLWRIGFHKGNTYIRAEQL